MSAPLRSRRAPLVLVFLDSDKQYSAPYFETARCEPDDAPLARTPPRPKSLRSGTATARSTSVRWGGLGLYLAEIAGADRHWHHAWSTEQLCRFPTHHAPRREPVRFGAIPAPDYLATVAGPFDRIAKIGRHVRTCRRQFTYDKPFSGAAPTLDRRRRHDAASRSAVPKAQSHQSGRDLSSPGGYFGPFPKGGRRSALGSSLVCDLEI